MKSAKMGRLAVLAILAAGAAISAAAQDSILLTNGRRLAARSIQWREGEKAYRVETPEGAISTIPKAQVQKVDVRKPADWDKAAGMMAAKQYAAAVPLLDGIATSYRMLGWDGEARRLLANAYLGLKEPKKAADALESYMEQMPKAEIPMELTQTYWNVLLQAGRGASLKKDLDDVIASGPRPMVAAAMMMRGNMSREGGQKEPALLDYLRVVILFDNIRELQPEALFKAAEILDELRDPRADELRKKLVQEYKDSEYAAKVSGKI